MTQRPRLISKHDVDFHHNGSVQTRHGSTCTWSFVAYKPAELDSRLTVTIGDWTLSKTIAEDLSESEIEEVAIKLAEALDGIYRS